MVFLMRRGGLKLGHWGYIPVIELFLFPVWTIVLFLFC